jgi:hypothetical protein
MSNFVKTSEVIFDVSRVVWAYKHTDSQTEELCLQLFLDTGDSPVLKGQSAREALAYFDSISTAADSGTMAASSPGAT